MFIYTTIDGGRKQTYEGFRRVLYRTPVPSVVASVTIEGEWEWWELNPECVELAVEELERFYRSEYGLDVQVNVYTRKERS